MRKSKISYCVFRFIRYMVWFFYPEIQAEGLKDIPDEPVIIAGNHTKMNGPISCELYLPDNFYTWCAGEMMNLKDVPAYAFKDFWSEKPKRVRWFYKILSYIIAPVSVAVFNNARTVAVYRDTRILDTFRESVSMLSEGRSLVIFPEHNKEYNNIVYEFQEKFVDVARIYYKKTGKEINFVPLYIAPTLKKMFFGQPVRFCAENPIEEERKRICGYLMDEITRIAQELPLHVVVPYPNIPKKRYPLNKEEK